MLLEVKKKIRILRRMCFLLNLSYMELQIDESVVVQSIYHHQIQVLLCKSFLFKQVVVSLDSVNYERNENL